MGVNSLWTIIAQTREKISMREMGASARKEGRDAPLLAVDVSTWLVAFAMVPHTAREKKPYLRYLFQRLNKLIRFGARLVLVLDGEAPALRRSQRSKGEQTIFRRMSREARTLCGFLGLPCLQAKGEAEALCAQLDKEGIVDGILTTDGDAFVYGAQRIYRFEETKEQDITLERYTLASLKAAHGLEQDSLLLMALLLGCDFCEGVPQVGPNKVTNPNPYHNLNHNPNLDRNKGAGIRPGSRGGRMRGASRGAP